MLCLVGWMSLGSLLTPCHAAPQIHEKQEDEEERLAEETLRIEKDKEALLWGDVDSDSSSDVDWTPAPPPRSAKLRARDKPLKVSLYSLLEDVEYVCVDEADKVLQPLSKYASWNKQLSRKNYPKPAEVFLHNLYARNKTAQLVCASATINAPLRTQIRRGRWGTTLKPTTVRVGKIMEMPKDLTHRYVLVKETQTGRMEVDKDVDSLTHMLDDATWSKLYSLRRLRRALGIEHAVAEQPEEASLESELERSIAETQGSSLVERPTTIPTALLFFDNNIRIGPVLDALKRLGFSATALHEHVQADDGANSFERLQHAVSSGEYDFVVTTQESSRGLDFAGLSYVFLMGNMSNPQDYLHMAGRTARGSGGRAGGTVVSMLLDTQTHFLKPLNKYLPGARIEQLFLRNVASNIKHERRRR